MNDDVLISVRDLSVGWGDSVLLADVEFDVPRGDVFAILGGSGCGKSTLLRHMVGLDPPLAGEIEIAGVGSSTLEVGRPNFGVMFQSGALFGSMTVGDNLALPLREWTALPHDAVDAVVRAKLGLVGLGGYENHMPSEISGGMKKRAAIARSMALDPELIFLDEPSAGLDPITAAEIDELIVALNRGLGVTVVLVTHELSSIYAIAKHCIMLDKQSKGIIARGDPRELRDHAEDERVRSFFHRTTRSP
jgi:phospholipid/cholesterol/gamma-HCH transport system ATP-binding protein